MASTSGGGERPPGVGIAGLAPQPESPAEGPPEDCVHLLVDWTIRPVGTGREASMTMHHYWRLQSSKVTYFRGSEDTELTAQVIV
jgi:hypothetical protein